MHTDLSLFKRHIPMHAAGTFYKASGLIKPKRLLLSLFGGISLSVLIGWLFYFLTNFISFVYLNFILLFGVLCAAIVAFTLLRLFSKSRHHILNVSLAALFCYLAWSAQWTFYNQHWNFGYSFLEGVFNPFATFEIIARRIVQIDTAHFNRSAGRFPFSGGLAGFFYVIEFIAFMLPVKFLLEDKQYYCERCDRFYDQKDAFITETGSFYATLGDAGENNVYNFLPEVSYYSKLAPIYARTREIVKVTIHYCPKCLENNIISVSAFEQQPDSDNQNKAPLTNEIEITRGMYIEKDTAHLLIRKFA
ncbi:hypothetical protein [Chitinophaga pinensis]|uniref:Uncharacterized protein n=1 Tax=Chitinophaga pinensis TaxID=79329 RepID=A0A5C6LK26_9BACT|nr:hypothetical protein [Chitinophaga pinensis]TWV93035.1 hypothetical protein FEF09_27560 [Chitinophaga pinensis]